MIRTVAVPALAVLFAGFFLACQDSTPNLTQPEVGGPKLGHKPGHNPGGGGGSPNTVLASASGAIENLVPDPSVMDVYKDNSFEFEINTSIESQGTTLWSFLATHGAGLDACSTSGPQTIPWTTLFDLLNGSIAGDGGFAMIYDKQRDGQTSENHGAAARGHYSGMGHVIVGILGHVDPSVVGTKGIDADGNDTYTFGGGTVRVWLKEGPPKKQQKLFCPNEGDEVVITVLP